MKKIILILVCVALLAACNDYFDPNDLGHNSTIPNGNEIIKLERLYGSKTGRKHFYYSLLSNDNSMYYVGISGGTYTYSYHETPYDIYYYIVGKINESGDIVWETNMKNYQEENVLSYVGLTGLAQNAQNDLYIYGRKLVNDNTFTMYIANVSKDGAVKEVTTTAVPHIDAIGEMKHITNNLFLCIGYDSENSQYWLLTIELSGTNITVINSVLYNNSETTPSICYAEQIAADNYEAVLINTNTKSQMFAQKINLTSAGVFTLWKQVITSDIIQNPQSTLTSNFINGSIHKAVKVDNEICIVGYGDNDLGVKYTDGKLIERGLAANINYSTGDINWLKTIPYGNSSVGGVYAIAILYLDNNFYICGEYSGKMINNQSFSYGFVQKIDRNGDLSEIKLFGNNTNLSLFYDAIILNRKLFLFGATGRVFDMDFPYQNLMNNRYTYQGWFVSCNINDF
jgi:hypothetical protein